MKNFLRAALIAALLATLGRAADEALPFMQTLSAAQQTALGLAVLTPEQRAALDAAVAAYARGEKTAAVADAILQTEQKAKQAEQKAAETAVADYKKKSEPGLIARTMQNLKRAAAEEKLERFTEHVAGEFRGWQGGTYFPLENGQVWRQVGADVYELSPVSHAAVEIFQSGNGYWRLKYAGGWITVKRLQ